MLIHWQKGCRIENENIITQSNTIANEPCDLINNNTITDIQSIEDYSITSKATALLVLNEEIKEEIINYWKKNN